MNFRNNLKIIYRRIHYLLIKLVNYVKGDTMKEHSYLNISFLQFFVSTSWRMVLLDNYLLENELSSTSGKRT